VRFEHRWIDGWEGLSGLRFSYKRLAQPRGLLVLSPFVFLLLLLLLLEVLLSLVVLLFSVLPPLLLLQRLLEAKAPHARQHASGKHTTACSSYGIAQMALLRPQIETQKARERAGGFLAAGAFGFGLGRERLQGKARRDRPESEYGLVWRRGEAENGDVVRRFRQ